MFTIGVDLGQQSDYSTIAVMRQAGEDLHLVHLDRLPLHTDYVEVVRTVMRIYGDPRLVVNGTPPLLIVDETGVGRGVADLLGVEGTAFYAVTITGKGEPRPYARRGVRTSWRVPKATLVEALEGPFRNGHLKVAPSLRWGATLAHELQAFRRKVDAKTAHVRYEHATTSEHDDLVLACALAAWGASTVLGVWLCPRTQEDTHSVEQATNFSKCPW